MASIKMVPHWLVTVIFRWTDFHTFVSSFSNVCNSACVWPADPKLGRLTNFYMLLVYEILINIRNICVRSICLLVSKSRRYQWRISTSKISFGSVIWHWYKVIDTTVCLHEMKTERPLLKYRSFSATDKITTIQPETTHKSTLHVTVARESTTKGGE